MGEDPLGFVVGAVIVLVVAVPLCLAGFAVAAWASRLLGRRGQDLPYVLHDAGDPEAERPRVLGLWFAENASLAVFVVVLVFAAVAGSAPIPVDYALLALGAPAALVGALAVLLFWPIDSAAVRGSLSADSPPLSELAPRWLLASIGGGTGVLVGGLLLAGAASTRDPSSGRLLALNQPTILDWSIGAGGQVIDIVYAPGGVTAPWPGWAWGGPVLVGGLVAAALLTGVVVRLRQPDGTFGSGEPAVAAAVRYHVGTFVGVLCASTIALALGAAMVVAGVALASAALMPLPSPSGLRSASEYALREPMHLWSWALRGLGVTLLAASGVGVLLAGQWAHRARVAHRAARVVF